MEFFRIKQCELENASRDKQKFIILIKMDML